MSRSPLRRAAAALTSVAIAVLAACGTAPRGGRDGPGANPPPNLMQVPDAEPRVEPIRSGGPNKPYEVFGRGYTPMAGDPPFAERGLASWYGRKFHGRPTSSGEIYDMYAMTAAHKTMPLPSYARVRNPANGREIVVRVNDRGPFHAGRVIDLSYTAALKLGVLNAVAPVEVERITFDAIRTGAWRGGDTRVVVAPGAAAPAPTATSQAAPAPAAAPAPLAVTAVALPQAATIEADNAAAAEPAYTDAAPASARPLAAASPGFWMQLGAFRERDGAFDFQRKVERELDWLAPRLAVFVDRELHRLQAGPYATRSEASSAAERLRSELQLVPLIVERR
jgi:rare lipoprotein A